MFSFLLFLVFFKVFGQILDKKAPKMGAICKIKKYLDKRYL